MPKTPHKMTTQQVRAFALHLSDLASKRELSLALLAAFQELENNCRDFAHVEQFCAWVRAYVFMNLSESDEAARRLAESARRKLTA